MEHYDSPHVWGRDVLDNSWRYRRGSW